MQNIGTAYFPTFDIPGWLWWSPGNVSWSLSLGRPHECPEGAGCAAGHQGPSESCRWTTGSDRRTELCKTIVLTGQLWFQRWPSISFRVVLTTAWNSVKQQYWSARIVTRTIQIFLKVVGEPQCLTRAESSVQQWCWSAMAVTRSSLISQFSTRSGTQLC